MKDISPLIQRSNKSQHQSRCNSILFTLLSFVFVIVGLGVYLSEGIRHQSSTKPHVATSNREKQMKLTFFDDTLSTYKGAVLEYQSVYHKSYYYSSSGTLIRYDPITTTEEAQYWQNKNIERIAPYIEQAADESVDILVLSECALNGLVWTRDEMSFYLESVPDPEGKACVSSTSACTPCDNSDFDDRSTLQQLSCLAKTNRVNLVVNYGDIVDCDVSLDSNCNTDGHYQYNTQIVFDYEGVIISKYYKIHLYKEPEYDTPESEDPTTFTITLPSDETTQVTFGIIICYDSIYGSPLLPLVKDEGITNFVMSHWWVNTAPFMNAAMWTQAVSQTYGVNVLVAANWWTYEGPTREYGARDSSGSGLYTKGTVKTDYYNQNSEDVIGVLLTADMPMRITSNAAQLPALPDYITIHKKEIQNYCELKSFLGEVVKKPTQEESLKTFSGALTCSKTGFTCSVTATLAGLIDAEGTDTARNWIMMYAYSGYYQTPDDGGVYYYENFCSIAVCDENCYFKGLQGDTTRVKFVSVSVSGNYDDDSTMFILSANDGGKAVDGNEVEYQTVVDSATGITTVSAEKIDKVLLNLSVMGRVFSKDANTI